MSAVLESAVDRVAVLVVDDSPDQRMLLRTHFEKAGCVVDIASTAEEAIVALESSSPDLVVLDLILPGMTGWELAEVMRSTRPDLPVAITSVLQPNRYPESSARLPKPFSGAAVRSVLGQCVPRWAAA